MTDLFDYLTWRGDLSMKEAPFNQVDGLILSTFSYIDPLPEQTADFPISLKQLGKGIKKQPAKERKLHMRKDEDLDLIDAMAKSERFGSLSVLNFTEIISTEDDSQFAAYLLSVDKKNHIIVFRGTDHSIVGWKEDLNLSYMDAVPGQLRALAFLRESMEKYPGKYIICGHSKGGNLSVYAGTSCQPEEFKCIKGIYNYDGPGFSDEFMSRDAYISRIPKIHTFIPESSVIGCLFDHREPCGVVSSKNVGGLAQHDPYSWIVLGGKLTPADRKNSSYIMDQTFKELVSRHTPEQRMKFSEALFGLFEETGSSRFEDLLTPANITSVIRSYSQMDDETKDIFSSMASVFGKSFTESFKETYDSIREEKSEQKQQKKEEKAEQRSQRKEEKTEQKLQKKEEKAGAREQKKQARRKKFEEFMSGGTEENE